MRLTRIVAACLVALPVLAMSATLDNSNIDTRTTTNVLTFSDLAFDNLDQQRADFLRFHGSIGDSGLFSYTGYFGPTVVVSVVPGSGMSVSNQARDPSTGHVSYTAAITGTTGLTIRQSWDMTTNSPMVKGVSSDGLATLEFIGANGGFLKTGGVFDYSVTLPGDWSAHGTDTGDSQILGLASGFTFTKDFVFDAATNTTTVEVLDTDYGSGNPFVNLDFILYGSAIQAVSEPMSPALMLGGLAVLACISRRRRSR